MGDLLKAVLAGITATLQRKEIGLEYSTLAKTQKGFDFIPSYSIPQKWIQFFMKSSILT